MASNPATDDLEVVEIVSYDRNDRENENVETKRWKCMEVHRHWRCEGEQTNERVQESSEKIKRQMQSSIQNVMPAVARNVQVLGVLAVNSSDEFQMKSSKTTAKNCKR